MRQRRRTATRTRIRERKPRTNEQIRATPVLLVTEDGAKEMRTDEAIALAREQELDLIEVSPKARPPVVKIGDIGQYMYAQRKKERKQRLHSKQTEVKTLRFGFRTERHDLQRLMDRAREFLSERHLVKFIIRLRGRELTNKEYAREKLRKVISELDDCSEVEQEIKKQGNQFIVILRARK